MLILFLSHVYNNEKKNQEISLIKIKFNFYKHADSNIIEIWIEYST